MKEREWDEHVKRIEERITQPAALKTVRSVSKEEGECVIPTEIEWNPKHLTSAHSIHVKTDTKAESLSSFRCAPL